MTESRASKRTRDEGTIVRFGAAGHRRRWDRGAWLGAVGGNGATPSRGLRIKEKKKKRSAFLKTPTNRPTAFSRLSLSRPPPTASTAGCGARVSRVPRLTSTWDARRLRIFGRRARVGT